MISDPLISVPCSEDHHITLHKRIAKLNLTFFPQPEFRFRSLEIRLPSGPHCGVSHSIGGLITVTTRQ